MIVIRVDGRNGEGGDGAAVGMKPFSPTSETIAQATGTANNTVPHGELNAPNVCVWIPLPSGEGLGYKHSHMSGDRATSSRRIINSILDLQVMA
ncbi:pyruvate dehydrogenase [Anopheles sinensis]|uniref:Pyruvate dehydrogenase n=1 Tax=Anopheles sinensis TaxID=74873 RepID=A0A084WI14_ANOSI|nr:pyruvate dehydrogenase [Anopheles sinensis]